MKVSKVLLAAAGTLVALGAGTLTALRAKPAEAAFSPTGLIDRLVERFNLNKDDVQAVFDEHHAGIRAEQEQRIQDRLAQAVTDGKITQEQADLISTKQEELKTYMESLKDKTPEERHDAMKTKMDEIKQWAEDNNIPLQYLHGGMKGPRRGFGKHIGKPFRGFNK
ncbi:MAG: hypothetical protein DRZ76_03640 [Candidatus Nealsonbacteria bacterium]|nr:MAG: hypothetical protein DRZ76_03640 [Candidatus Nealsonbacteria bacterium]